jgi:hypothetical protein
MVEQGIHKFEENNPGRLVYNMLGYITEETIVLVNDVGVMEDIHTVEMIEKLIFWYGRDTRGENIIKIQNTHQGEMGASPS